jgi:alginate O-acetyltransferase complex protein AlgI
MLFPTIDFAIFFVLVFVGHWLLNFHRLAWKLFMITASCLFYAWWNWRLVGVLLLVAVLAQAGSQIMFHTVSPRRRRAVMAVTVVAVLLPLLWFKYYGFFSLTLANGLSILGAPAPIPLIQVLLPVGISFYTFMAISYVVDIFRGDLRPAGWIDFLVYLSFFPHLVAGPIVRGNELLPQFRTARDPRKVDLAGGASLIVSGLFKKVVISSYLAFAIVDPVFAQPGAHSALEVVLAAYGYAIVIYTDFSGYTDIALGVAKLLGFELPQNFDRPYTARTLQDFWRRWHMTLSRWLRDYLYIPLGGSRRGEPRTSINIMITMLLGGLWHGAGWTFVIWGGLHGLAQVVGHRRRAIRVARGLDPLPEAPRAVLWQRVATFHFVCLAWIFFRAESVAAAFGMLARLVTGWGAASTLITPLLLATIAGALAFQYLPRGPGERIRLVLSRARPAVQGIGLAVALFIITTLGPEGVAPFIYFQF